MALHTEIADGRLTISIDLSTLRFCAEEHPSLEEFDEKSGDFGKPRVTNIDVFAAEVLRTLEEEEEDGTTPIHRMLDAAIMSAIENGADGIVLPGDEP